MGENNWDLQAVVRSCTGQNVAPEETRDPFASFPSSQTVVEDILHVDTNHDGIFVPELSSSGPSMVEELEELYKPFFRSTSMPATSQPPQLQQQKPSLFFTQQPPQVQRTLSETTRSKKRKKQQKKVVCQVPVDGLSTDVWAWRKYGQKPIKGSPYPRGYYRCSSSKGCPARKQVERSRTEPDVLLITYTAEHNHAIPTHRNSLAGSTRHKLNPTSPKANPENVNEASTPSPSPAVPADTATPELEEEEEDMDGGLPRLSTGLGTSGGVDDEFLFSALDDRGQPSPSDQFTSIFSSSPWTPSSTTVTAGKNSRLLPSSSV